MPGGAGSCQAAHTLERKSRAAQCHFDTLHARLSCRLLMIVPAPRSDVNGNPLFEPLEDTPSFVVRIAV